MLMTRPICLNHVREYSNQMNSSNLKKISNVKLYLWFYLKKSLSWIYFYNEHIKMLKIVIISPVHQLLLDFKP